MAVVGPGGASRREGVEGCTGLVGWSANSAAVAGAMWLRRGLPRALPTPAPRLRAAGWACSACRRSSSSSSADATTPALAIDLEGVVLRGGVVVEGAIETLRTLQELEVPFILLSNGSGNTEKAKASWISQRLGVEIT